MSEPKRAGETPQQRVAEFLRQYVQQRGLDPEVIYAIHTDPDADRATLLVSDLAALVASSAGVRADD